MTVLALAASRNNDRVGLLVATDRIERYTAPRKGRRHALRVVSELLGFEPQGQGTDLAAALESLEALLRRRAVDIRRLRLPLGGWEAVVGRLARRHDVIAVELVDPRERELPDVGPVTLWDPETGAWRVVDTGDPRVRERVPRPGEAFDRRLERTLARAGRGPAPARDGQSYAEPLLAFFRRRERMLWR